MVITVVKFMNLSTTETYEAQVEVPDDTEDPIAYLQENELLGDLNWEHVDTDDDLMNESYDVKS